MATSTTRKFAGKVVLITGGSSGIGFATGIELTVDGGFTQI